MQREEQEEDEREAREAARNGGMFRSRKQTVAQEEGGEGEDEVVPAARPARVALDGDNSDVDDSADEQVSRRARCATSLAEADLELSSPCSLLLLLHR